MFAWPQVEAFALEQLDRLLAAAQPATDAAAAAPPAEAAQAADSAAAAEAAAATAAAAHDGDGGGEGTQPSEAAVLGAARQCGLYCALCTKRHSLLPRLLEVRLCWPGCSHEGVRYTGAMTACRWSIVSIVNIRACQSCNPPPALPSSKGAALDQTSIDVGSTRQAYPPMQAA